MNLVPTLTRVCRGVRAERALFCPLCGGPCDLVDHRLVCASCGGRFSKLAELAPRTVLPWDFSTPVEGALTVPNVPTPEGAALGRELARLVDIEEAKQLKQFPHMQKRCGDCAARLGTEPNQCASTLMDLVKGAVEGVPFYCHKGIKDDEEPKRICIGWMVLQTPHGDSFLERYRNGAPS